ncbi:BLUF domain-containing protein [Tamlana crocina]|uniref:BLUF domain-containing protein n=1 Tax=Tamlana crocina TaxID=393006 RepID=A0ABX1DCS8_9FLAO|nr:BLUF domain-containing protein [Tamlana crocina]NJX16165.1 BLUF domain-containing protein [Tamlana crocina]
MLKTICYKSKVKPGLSILDTEALFQETQNNNNSLKITGVLIKKETVFFQILEGESNRLDVLYEKIKNDSRHSNIVELLNTTVGQLSFNNFETGYRIIQDVNSLYDLQNYLIKLEGAEAEHSATFLQMIEDLLLSDE